MPSPSHWALLSFLRLLPRNAISRFAGRLAGLPLPRFLRPLALGGFGRIFGVDFSEVRDPLKSFPSIQSFFIRRLKEGARTLDPDPMAFLSPCDGAWGQWGTVEKGSLLQIKGRPYSLAELLGDGVGGKSLADDFEGGTYLTLYLSPRDYHRFHTPCEGAISRARYLPGSLWPVNRAGVEGVEGLFARNERICAFLDLEQGQLAMVAVGATMVGKVKVVFDRLETNKRGAKPVERTYVSPFHFERGAEWGHFEFGSTLVLVATPGSIDLQGKPSGAAVRLGEKIGTLGIGNDD